MVFEKHSIDGKVIGKIEANDAIFKAEVNNYLIYELINAANANRRQGTASTKRRAEVRGGGSKPWRQKGTGRARQGSIRSPQWKGGGVVFGPKPKCYHVDLPKSMKRRALISLFSLKTNEGAIKVIEDFEIKEGKTKEAAKIGNAFDISKGVLITESEDVQTKRAIKNIPWFVYNNAKRISSRDIFYSRTILITESAINYLNSKFTKD